MIIFKESINKAKSISGMRISAYLIRFVRTYIGAGVWYLAELNSAEGDVRS